MLAIAHTVLVDHLQHTNQQDALSMKVCLPLHVRDLCQHYLLYLIEGNDLETSVNADVLQR